jgi:cytochrome c peroxidase
MKRFVLSFLLCGLALPLGADEGAYGSPAAWGEALFFDVNLSKNRTQSCATCHQPDAGFVDKRETAAGRRFPWGTTG